MTIDEISDNFSLLDEWDDRYRYIIELGRTLAPLPAEAHIDANKVQGCASQVWLTTSVRPDGSGGPILTFRGDSDAHIVRGLIAILFALYSDKSARDILATDPYALFERLGLHEHLTPQRSNGLKSMVARIRAEAATALRQPIDPVVNAPKSASPLASNSRRERSIMARDDAAGLGNGPIRTSRCRRPGLSTRHTNGPTSCPPSG